VGASHALDARARGAGAAIVRVCKVRVCEGARRRARGVGVAAGRGRALVSRVHGGGVVGERREAQLDFGRLGSGRRGQRVAAGGQRGHDAAGIGVPAQARWLRGQEDAAQHDGQPVKRFTQRGEKSTNDREVETKSGAEVVRSCTYMLSSTGSVSKPAGRVPGLLSSVRSENRLPDYECAYETAQGPA
jgi:hypothetical protein